MAKVPAADVRVTVGPAPGDRVAMATTIGAEVAKEPVPDDRVARASALGTVTGSRLQGSAAVDWWIGFLEIHCRLPRSEQASSRGATVTLCGIFGA